MDRRARRSARLGTLNITFTGGEPMAHPEIMRILRAARERAFVVRLFTNATLIDDAAADEIASLKLLAVEVSIHGATPRCTIGRRRARDRSLRRSRRSIA
jgi:MoaA/NifB/PqqE/SkfB family radical SAM enzyme